VFSWKTGEKTHSEIFEHILNKALNHRMVDPNTIFIDGTHIKASANKKKYQKEQVAKAAKVYSGRCARRFMRSAKKPLNGSLQTRKRNTRCALYTPQRLGLRHTMGQA